MSICCGALVIFIAISSTGATATGVLKVHVDEVDGAGFTTDVNIYEVINGSRVYVGDFYTDCESGNGSMILAPGTYDVWINTRTDEWIEGVTVVAGEETYVSQSYGRIKVHVDEVGGAGFSADVNLHPGGDFNTDCESGDGSVILAPGTYDVWINTATDKWIEGVAIAAGEESYVSQSYGRVTVLTTDGSGSPVGGHVSLYCVEDEVSVFACGFDTSSVTGKGSRIVLPGTYDVRISVGSEYAWYRDVEIVAGNETRIPGGDYVRAVHPSFLGSVPAVLELMEGGRLVLTYVLQDAAGNPLPDTSIELNATCTLTNSLGIFFVEVDEAKLAAFGAPTGQPDTYLLEPLTGVHDRTLADPPVVTVEIVPREWQTKWSGGSRVSASILGLKAAEGSGYEMSLHHDDTLTFGIRFEQGAGIASSIGASVSLTSKLKRGAELGAEVLLTHAQEKQYRFNDLLDPEQMLAFSGLMFWSVLELGHKSGGIMPTADPVMGFIADALLDLVVPWATYRTEYTSMGGIDAKAEVIADLQGFTSQAFSLAGVPKDVLQWQFLDTGSGAAAELTAEINVGQTAYLGEERTGFFLACESELDGYVDLPLDISFPIDALIGGRAALVLGGDEAVELVCEIASRDGDDVVLDRFTVHSGQDVNGNSIDDLAEVLAHHAVMFVGSVVDELLAPGSAVVDIVFPGGIVALLKELERVVLRVGIALEYETVCYRDLGDITLDPSLIIGLLVENGLGVGLTLQKETVWLRERGIWYDGEKYPSEVYTFDSGLLGDSRTLYQMWMDAAEGFRDLVWAGIEAGTEYVVEEVVPEIPWGTCVVATLAGGLPAGGACVGGSAGTIIATDFVEYLGRTSGGVESRDGALVVPDEPPPPDEPAEWEGILAIGGFYSLFPQGVTFTPPAQLTLSYSDDVLPLGLDESSLDIFAWDTDVGHWQPLGAIVSPETNSLSTGISMLTTYVVGVDVAPGRPSNLEAAAGTSAVTLVWDVAETADLQGFFVYRSLTETGTYERLTDTAVESTTYVDGPVGDGVWYYTVTSIDAAGNESSPATPVCVRVGESGAVFRVASQGDVMADQTFYAKSFESVSADVAEWIEVSEGVAPGDVLELDPSRNSTYRLTRSACSSLVAGVVSTQPGFLLGQDVSPENRALLALSGIVPVKVTDEGGLIRLGDLLVSSSTPGHAMRWSGVEPCSCALVGKALEPMNQESGVILVLLTAH